MSRSALEKASPEGVVKIHENVISSIIRRAVLGTDGVVQLAGAGGLAGMVGSRSAITIRTGPGTVSAEIRVILRYGVYIPTVAREIQNRVIKDVSDSTGMTVENAAVIVMDLEEEENKNE